MEGRSLLLQADGHAWHHGLLWPLLLARSRGGDLGSAQAALRERLAGLLASEGQVRGLVFAVLIDFLPLHAVR